MKKVSHSAAQRFITPTHNTARSTDTHSAHIYTYTHSTRYQQDTTKRYLCNMTKGLAQFGSVKLCDLSRIQLKSHHLDGRSGKRRKEENEQADTYTI